MIERRGPPPRRERGFALVVVLWIVGLMAVLSATLSLSVRTRVRIAANITESARAESLADAGVALAILDIGASRSNPGQNPGQGGRFAVNGSGAGCSVGEEGDVFVTVRDEATRVDVNTAGVPLLQALLAGLGETPQSALALAETIFDFRDTDNDRKAHGAERTEYLAAGFSWTPKNAPFDTVDEIGQALGVSPSLLERMRPYVTVYSGQEGVDADGASGMLIDALRRGAESAAGTFASFPELDAAHPLPAMFVSASRRRAYSVRVEAMAAGGARFVRDAVLTYPSRRATTPVLSGWRRGALSAGEAAPVKTSGGLPPC